MMQAKEAGVGALDQMVTPPPTADLQASVMKVFTADPVALAEELSTAPITYPCIVVLGGSMLAAFEVSVSCQLLNTLHSVAAR